MTLVGLLFIYSGGNDQFIDSINAFSFYKFPIDEELEKRIESERMQKFDKVQLMTMNDGEMSNGYFVGEDFANTQENCNMKARDILSGFV